MRALPSVPAAVASLITAIVSSGHVDPAPEDLAAALGLDPDALADAIAEGEAAGYLASWETDGRGFRVTLAPRAVGRLRVEICARTRRWVPFGRSEPEEPLPLRGIRESDLAGRPGSEGFDLDQLPDGHDEGPAWRPRIDLVLGVSFAGWPPVWHDDRCPVCRSLAMPDNAYCLECNAGGPPPPTAARPDRRAAPPARPADPTPMPGPAARAG